MSVADPTDAVSIRPGVGAASFWFPHIEVVSAWHEHAPFGFWMMSALRPATVVELGTHNGFSAFVFAEAVRRLGLPTRIHAVDTWAGDDQAGFYGESVYESVQAVVDAEYPGMELVRSYFSDVVSRFDDGSIDLLHIDGRHGYDDVREDWELYRPKLSARGVALFHDVHEFAEGFGVHRFWAEVAGEYPSFAFQHGHGLGVLAAGSEVPDAVNAFLRRAAEEPDAVRREYQQLGAAVAERLAVSAQIAALEAGRIAWEAERARLAAILEARDATIAELRDSTSWRVTRPLRAVSALRRRNG